jgi:hypothetical protein
MGLLEQLGKSVSQGLDRARFEAEKFQKVSRIQGEVNEIKKTIDSKLIDLGQRAYDLQRAGQISFSSVAELANNIDELRSMLVLKEEELTEAQSHIYEEDESMQINVPPPIHSPNIERGGPENASWQQKPQPSAPQPSAPQPSARQPAPQQQGPQRQTPEEDTPKVCPVCHFRMSSRAVYCPNCGYHVGRGGHSQQA